MCIQGGEDRQEQAQLPYHQKAINTMENQRHKVIKVVSVKCIGFFGKIIPFDTSPSVNFS